MKTISEKMANEHFEQHKHIAKSVAFKFSPNDQFAAEDIQQEAAAALWELCLEGHGTQPGGWLHTAVYNKVARVLRTAAPIPPETMRRLQAIHKASEELQAAGIAATDSAIASHLGMTEDTVRQILSRTHYQLEIETAPDTAAEDTEADQICGKIKARRNMELLAWIMQGYTQAEIAEKFGVSRQRIHQRYFKLINRLRKQFDAGSD